MADVQQQIQVLLDDLVARDVERGVQVAAYFNGECIVDAWAGIADPATGRLVDGDTVFCSFSVCKGFTTTLIHRLVDRGQLAYDVPIAAYWPEFGAHGKARITLRHVLAHTAGIPQLPPDVTVAEFCDWPTMCQAIVDAQPLWEPGTATGYHAWTWGWILGEVAQRVAGQSFAALIEEEIGRPLGLDALYFGIPNDVEPHVAILEPGPGHPWPPPAPDALVARALPWSLQPFDQFANRADVRRACQPAAGAIMNARAIARLYAALCGGAADGIHLLTPERVSAATTLETEETDLVLGFAPRKALGYWLGDGEQAFGERITAFGHPGVGGALGFADPEYRFAFGLTKNRLTELPPKEDTGHRIAEAIRTILGIPEDAP